MRRTQIRIKWNVHNACVLGVDIRKKKNYLGNLEEYAVLQVGTITDFDELSLEDNPSVQRVKPITLMCFIESIFKHIHEGRIYSFAGKVGFGYGNTYLVIMEAYLPGGFSLNETDSEEEMEEGGYPSSSLEEGESETSVLNVY